MKLLEILSSRKGSTFVGIEYTVDARLRKRGNSHPNVQKTVKANVCTNYNYSHALEKRMIETGKDAVREVHARSFGKHVKDTPFIEHNGKYYLDCMVNKVLDVVYRDTDSGKELSPDIVKPFLPHNPGLVKVSNIGLDKIKVVKTGGEVYEVTN